MLLLCRRSFTCTEDVVNITGATGISAAQRAALRALGPCDELAS
jgi:hypothetical protein